MHSRADQRLKEKQTNEEIKIETSKLECTLSRTDTPFPQPRQPPQRQKLNASRPHVEYTPNEMGTKDAELLVSQNVI